MHNRTIMETVQERVNYKDLKIFQDEIKGFLPEEIIDFHIHLWKKDFFHTNISKNRSMQNPFLGIDIKSFAIEDFKNVTEKIFPGKKYYGIFFGLPVKEINIERINEYISDICVNNNSYGLFIPEPKLKVIPEDFIDKRFIGFKPYPDLANYSISEDFSKLDINIGIFDFISKKVLEFSQNHKLILLIHLPRKERLNSKKNIEEIKKINNEYPDIKIVLAHAGRSYCYDDIRESIKYIRKMKNLYVDTAMINNISVNKILIEELGTHRILYGSDLPLAVLKGKNVEINKKHYFITDTPRSWSLSSKEMSLDNFTFFIYENIRAIKHAILDLNLNKNDIENIFYKNAKKLIESIINNEM